MYAFTHVNGLLVFAYLSTSGFSHPLEESPHKPAPQRAKTSTHWNNHPTNTASSGQIPPVTGRKCPHTSSPTGKNLQQLEESPRYRPSQRPKSSTHWRKTDAHEPLNGKNPPVTGRITPPQTIPATQILHPLEESGRSQGQQREDYSSGWKNTDFHALPSGEIVPVDGRIETWTVLSRTWVEFTRIAATKKAYRVLRALSVSLIGG